MTYLTHFWGGAVAGVLAAVPVSSPPENMLITALAGGFAAVIPDIDHAGSAINRVFFPGRAVSLVVTHRGPTHSVLAALVLCMFLKLLGLPFLYAFAAAAGYLSHLLLDLLNPAGVPLLWPLFGKKFTAPVTVRTGGVIEQFLIRPACALITLCVFLMKTLNII